MRLGPGIRIALAAATLLAQLALPLAHGLGIATEQRSLLNGPAAVIATTSDPSTSSGHDPNLCPTCLALTQARAGICHAIPAGFFVRNVLAAAPALEPEIVLPRAPELAAAPPRAPPALALSFA